MGRANAQPSLDDALKDDDIEGDVVSLASTSHPATAALQAGESESSLAITLRTARRIRVTEQDIQRCFALGQWDESIGRDRETTVIDELEREILYVENGIVDPAHA